VAQKGDAEASEVVDRRGNADGGVPLAVEGKVGQSLLSIEVVKGKGWMRGRLFSETRTALAAAWLVTPGMVSEM
jgi:hypothetical protein